MGIFNIIDILILLLFIPALIGGIKKGFIRQLAGLAALILGIWAAVRYNDILSGILGNWFKGNSSVVNIISFIIIFTIVLLAVSLVGRLASRVFRAVMLGWLDRIVGVIFSILKTAFILSVVIYILNSLDSLYSFMPKESISESRLYPRIKEIAPSVFPYFKEFTKKDPDKIIPDSLKNI
jgi:membrane protein required for colicin V production